MRPAGVAQSEARLLASGALLQQAAQGAGLLVLLTIVTILARRLPVAELGAYGLVASLAGYLLVLRNSVASSAVRAMAAAVDPAERRLVFSAAAVLYALAGLATGLLIAGAGLLIAGLILDGDLAADGRAGGARPGRGDRARGERQRLPRRAARGAPVRARRRDRDRRRGALPRDDARADLRRRGPGRADRRERPAPALQRDAVGAGGAPRRPRPARPAVGSDPSAR